jgi:hypothetical protein
MSIIEEARISEKMSPSTVLCAPPGTAGASSNNSTLLQGVPTTDASKTTPRTEPKPIRKSPHHHDTYPLLLRSSLKHSHGDDPTNDTMSTVASSTPSTGDRHLKFDKVFVQTYGIEISDNPACSIGAPVQIAWQPESLVECDLDAYEIERLPVRRHNPRHLVLNYYRRHQMLLEAGYDEQTIQNYGKQVSRAQRQRSVTQLLLPIFMFQELKISASRRVHCPSWKRRKSSSSSSSSS